MPQSNKKIWLIRNDGVELEVAGGPFLNDKDLEAGLLRAIRRDNAKEEITYHTTVSDKRPLFEEFSGGYMEDLRTAVIAELDSAT